MSLQEFTRAAGTAGQLLFNNLQHLKWNGDYLSPYPLGACWEECRLTVAGFLVRDIKGWSHLQILVAEVGREKEGERR